MDQDEKEHRLPGLGHDAWAWVKIAALFAVLVAVNIVAFLVSFGWGVVITLPLTIFLGFLLVRDLAPRHRLPPGRPHSGLPV